MGKAARKDQGRAGKEQVDGQGGRGDKRIRNKNNHWENVKKEHV